MARYIDADKIEYDSNINYHGTNYKMTSEIYINNMPTEDVKPIVYCKNCKFQDDIQGCIRLNIFVDKNTFYCEYAMRKESEEE